MDRMASIKGLKCRFLIEEGDTNIVASHYATYKTISKENFDDIPVYIYGDKTAFIVFQEDDVEVFVMKHVKITRLFRKRFQDIWDIAKAIKPK